MAKVVTGDPAARYALGNDIVLTQEATAAIIGGEFLGFFNGFGNKVTGLRIAATTTKDEIVGLGLFEKTGSGSLVRNLGVETRGDGVVLTASGSKVSGRRVGIVAGEIGDGGVLKNSYAKGKVAISAKDAATIVSVGGLVGDVGGWIEDTFAVVDVMCSATQSGEASNCGGLVGTSYSGDIIRSFTIPQLSVGTVFAVGNVSNVGGLVGYIGTSSYGYSSVVNECYSAIPVTGASGANNIGGLVGYQYSYYSGDIIIKNSHAVGKVAPGNATYYGGLVGYRDGGSIANSYYSTDGTGQVICYYQYRDSCTGLSSAQMRDSNKFTDWDFASATPTWYMGDNYPELYWSKPLGGKKTHIVTATAGAGGTIDPPTSTVNHGATATFTVTPHNGYSIYKVDGCGGKLNDNNTYTTGTITNACIVTASFKQNTYTVTAVWEPGGKVSPDARTVDHGKTTTFTVTPNPGYSIASVTGCAGKLSGDIYTTGTITGHCTVSASFKAKPLAAFAGLVFNGDYNGDGKADLIWHNSASGETYGMLLDGLQIIAHGSFYHEPNTAWQIVQSGDFQGQGYASLLWWNRAEGWVYHMTVPVPGRGLTGTFIYHEPNTAWQIVAVGDLNADGRDDLIWWNDQTGQVWGMLTDDALLSGLPAVQQGQMYQETNTNWRILAARDFNGDGRADLLWRNQQTGEVYLMLMDGLRIVEGRMIYVEPRVNEWNIVAVGDLNGDGKADLVWWNSDSGLVWGILMDGFTIAQQGPFYQEPDTNWRIVSSGDYNGDGKDDLLWRHQVEGRIYQMPMNGLAALSGAFIAVAGQNWRIVADANGDATGIPTPSRALSGGQQFAPLGTESLNSYAPFVGEPLNPNLLPK